MNTLIKILIAFLIFFCNTTSAQVISYYPFQSIVSVSTATNKLLWLDYRIETNSFFSNLNMELSPMINLYKSDMVSGYMGLGVNFNPTRYVGNLTPLNGYAVNIGVRVRPLLKLQNLEVAFEIAPYTNYEFSNGTLRTRLGIGYNLKRIKK